MDFLFITFEKKISDLKMFLVFQVDFLFPKFEKNLSITKKRVGLFRNPPLPQISTFSSGQKRCAYYEESANLGCAY